jgi:hypothetical protein
MKFFDRYRPEKVGELTEVSLGDAAYDPDAQRRANQLSPVVTIESGIFTGTRVVREDAARPRGNTPASGQTGAIAAS